MKSSCLLFGLAVAGMAAVLAGVSCATTASSKTLSLFNGRDLSGWKAVSADPSVPMNRVWSVRDGVIHCAGEPMGYLHTERSFTNYRLEVEYRWAPGKEPGNSGIFGRITGEPRPLPRCIETQLKHGNAGDLYGFHGLKISGDPARFRHVPNHQLAGELRGVSRISGNEKPPGQWNRVVILAQGGTITVWFNGRLVNQATDAEVVAGPVGLQSEGGEIQFRNIRLTPLD